MIGGKTDRDKLLPGTIRRLSVSSTNDVYFEKLTALNNEMARLQRELAKKNKEMEQVNLRLNQSLAEKELLVQEIYHRVKNNTQLIASLLSLQSSYLQESGSREVFTNLQNRILAMAAVHEQLYKGKDPTHIDFAAYINLLVELLAESYQVKKGSIKITVKAGEVSLDIRKAIPCSLIINELVANVFKHAFPIASPGGMDNNKRKPEVTIAFFVGGEGNHVTISVRDNGVGLPRDFDMEKPVSMGMRLVKGLTRQLKGTLELDRSDGTAFIIGFPLQNEKA